MFESSDRARALLYRVVSKNPKYKSAFQNSCDLIDNTFNDMAKFGFDGKELDLRTGVKRISALKRAIDKGIGVSAGADVDTQTPKPSSAASPRISSIPTPITIAVIAAVVSFAVSFYKLRGADAGSGQLAPGCR